MTIFEDEIVDSKAFENASLIFAELWALTNEIKFDFLENEF